MDGQPEISPHSFRSGSPATRRILLVLWLCFLLRALFYCALFPMWEGYDEYSHFAFVQHVATNASLPLAVQTRASREIEESLKLVPLPWLLRNLPAQHLPHDRYWLLPAEERRQRQNDLRALPVAWAREPAAGELLIYEAQQPPLYYWTLALPLMLASNLGLPARVLLLRLFGILLASLAVPLTFAAANRVLSSRKAACMVTALVAVMPGLMVDICRVGNDSLALPLYSLLLYLAIKFFDDPGKSSIAAGLGLCLGLGLLTKAYFLAAGLAFALTVAIVVLREPGRRRKILAHAAFVLALVALIAGWWYWRVRASTGTWSGLMQDVELQRIPLFELLRKAPQVDWRSAVDSTFFSHIWFGNWSFLQVRSWMYHYFRGLALPALLGLVILIAGPWFKRTLSHPFLACRRHLLVLIAFYASFWLGLLYHVLLTFVANGISSSAGWYLYGVITAEVLLFALGLFALIPSPLRDWAVPVATASFGLLDLYTVHFLFIPYYSGLISHRANGALATLVVSRIRSEDLWTALVRLQVNKPWESSLVLPLFWVGYLAGTVALIFIVFRLAKKQCGGWRCDADVDC